MLQCPSTVRRRPLTHLTHSLVKPHSLPLSGDIALPVLHVKKPQLQIHKGTTNPGIILWSSAVCGLLSVREKEFVIYASAAC